jgi:hypothetical protein
LELFFEATTGRRQIRRIHQGDSVGLDALPAEQPAQVMLIDPAQSAHPQLCAKLMEHPRRRTDAAQPGKASPGGLFGQLRDQEIERTGGRQPRQQMHAPELGCAQNVPPAAGEITRIKLGDEIVGHMAGEQFEKRVGADGRQRSGHA